MSSRVKAEPAEDVVTSLGITDHEMEILDDDDEEIVREIDVFISPELSNQLHLIQFPLQRQFDRDVTASCPEGARVRPRHNMIELDYPGRTSTTGADDTMAQDYAGQFHMTTRTFSSHTIPISTHMALAKMVSEGEAPGLHLVPLSRISQMRPSFEHVNEATSNATETTEEEQLEQQKAQDVGTSRKPLAFQKKESERAALARKSSYGYKKASQESEMWHPLEVYPVGSLESDVALQKVSCPKPDEHCLEITSEPSAIPEQVESQQSQGRQVSLEAEYVKTLNYLPLSQRESGYEKLGENESGSALVANVVTQLVKTMHLGLPIPYQTLRERFNSSYSDETLFAGLNTCAFLVRGNFILQSRLMPLPPTLAKARTFILFLFQTMEIVHRARLENVYEDDDDVSAEAIHMILQQVGKLTREGWKLKVDDDVDFAAKHPTVVPIHLEFWSNQVPRFRPFIERYAQTPQTTQ